MCLINVICTVLSVVFYTYVAKFLRTCHFQSNLKVTSYILLVTVTVTSYNSKKVTCNCNQLLFKSNLPNTESNYEMVLNSTISKSLRAVR